MGKTFYHRVKRKKSVKFRRTLELITLKRYAIHIIHFIDIGVEGAFLSYFHCFSGVEIFRNVASLASVFFPFSLETEGRHNWPSR